MIVLLVDDTAMIWYRDYIRVLAFYYPESLMITDYYYNNIIYPYPMGHAAPDNRPSNRPRIASQAVL